jgi:hypothetical protein
MSKTEDRKRVFFIMAFGRDDMDLVWTKAYAPVCSELNLDPVRIDKVDNGAPKLDQILSEIRNAKLIVADLTYCRPNCYYEIGFAHACRAQDEVLMCAREDHIGQNSSDQNKIHFDISGYHIHGWNLEKLDDYRSSFKNVLEQRLKIIHSRKRQDPDEAAYRVDQVTIANLKPKIAEYLKFLESK